MGDTGSARALRYDLAAANAVIGQSLFTTKTIPANPSATSLTVVTQK